MIFCNLKVNVLITTYTSPTDCTMALGSTQPLVKMSIRNIYGGKGSRCVRLTSSPPSCAECHGTPLPLHICLNDLWASTSFGVQYLTHFTNLLVGYGNISIRLNPDMCPFPTNRPNYLHLNITYSVRKTGLCDHIDAKVTLTANPSFRLQILKQIFAPLFVMCITGPLDARH